MVWAKQVSLKWHDTMNNLNRHELPTDNCIINKQEIRSKMFNDKNAKSVKTRKYQTKLINNL